MEAGAIATRARGSRRAALGARLDGLDERGLQRVVLGVLALGLVLRLILAATTDGSIGDLQAFRRVRELVAIERFDFYTLANPPGSFAWPYLPGFLPLLELVHRTAEVTGLAFDRLIRLPAIAADVAIAWIVQWHLGWRGAAARTRVLAVTALALSPVGLALTGAHGQIDPLEWLPVVLAVVAWERLEGDRRAVATGLLVGLGVAIKPPAALAVLAFLVLAPSMRERLRFALAAAAIPAVVSLPFFLSDPGGFTSLLDYQSVPGQGGLSLILQPDLALARFAGAPSPKEFTPLNDALQLIAPLLVLALAGVVALAARRRRAGADATIAALTLAVFVASPNFLPPYLIWLLPFAVLAGWWRAIAVLFALSLLVLPFKYFSGSILEATGLGREPGLWDEALVEAVYIPANIVLWVVLAVLVGRWVWAAWRQTPAGADGTATLPRR